MSLNLLVAALNGELWRTLDPDFWSQSRSRRFQESPCLRCKTPKRHNNSFCSADCAKAYKKEKKVCVPS